MAQYGPEALISGSGAALVGATVTATPSGVVATVDSRGNLTLTGPPGPATFTVTPQGGSAQAPLTVNLLPGPDGTVVRASEYGAKGDAVGTITGAVSGTTLTNTTALFTSAMVGRTVVIYAAGTSGANHTTTVASVESSTSLTLAAAAPTAVASLARYAIGTDDTAAIQAALTALGTFGGGRVIVENLRYLLTGVLTLPDRVRLVGALRGPFDCQGSPTDVRNPAVVQIGPTLLPTNTVSSFITIGGASSGLDDLVIHYPCQVAPTGTVPKVYPFTVESLVSSQSLSINRVLITNAHSGFYLRGQRMRLQDILLGAYQTGFLVDEVYDVSYANNLHLWPYYSQTETNVYPNAIDTAVMQVGYSSIAYDFRRVDSLAWSNVFSFNHCIGMRFIDSGMTSPPSGVRSGYGQLQNVSLDTCKYAFYAVSTRTPGWTVNNFTGSNITTAVVATVAGGQSVPKLKITGGACPNTGFSLAATGSVIDITDVAGINKGGALATQPAVPASGGTVTTNTITHSPVQVVVSGGSGVEVIINGTTTAQGSGTFRLRPGNTIALNYTTAPTWYWIEE